MRVNDSSWKCQRSNPCPKPPTEGRPYRRNCAGCKQSLIDEPETKSHLRRCYYCEACARGCYSCRNPAVWLRPHQFDNVCKKSIPPRNVSTANTFQPAQNRRALHVGPPRESRCADNPLLGVDLEQHLPRCEDLGAAVPREARLHLGGVVPRRIGTRGRRRCLPRSGGTEPNIAISSRGVVSFLSRRVVAR